MMKPNFTFIFAFIGLILTSSASQAVNNLWYPFEVKVGSQMAKETGPSFATIPQPVPSNAEVETLLPPSDLMIINIFPSTANGLVDNAAKPEVIMVNGANKTKLDLTMSKNRLPAGTYLMNIMANGKTSRVVFRVL